jgi:outer membrane immunogenic protein
VAFARFEDDDWKFGWVVGGGIEYALNESWSLNAEYLYLDFGEVVGESEIPPPAQAGFTHTHKADLTAQILRAGLSFHFQ